ncbi:redoxin domain-containing protein [Oceanobacillus halophilus]|uniref:TlpA family protein disulfide reductase n=1 Tax=Oceanobacillus halophilus TaxID=930130 RepID=A0A495ACH2_9BACI|nr:redoxin domain-containing protein [Oceanobacillus halophilus]RKQ37294.1 TlpA family protein disulfide reductase [Oceanobacillus halophilus]
MKKGIIIIVVLLGMLTWAVFDFTDSKKNIDTQNTNNTEDVNSTSKEKINDGTSSDENPIVGLDIGNLAPDFELETLDGEVVTLSDFRGERVMINFWATWCPPCKAEMPDMEKFYQETNVTILAVNLTETETNIQQIQRFVDDYNLTFPILLDKSILVAGLYAIQPIPTSYMIDTDGIIQFKTFGPMTYSMMVQEYEKMN